MKSHLWGMTWAGSGCHGQGARVEESVRRLVMFVPAVGIAQKRRPGVRSDVSM